jgi:NTP pyrophosphatase (non-canonical NTP hydrolase)
MNKEEMEMIVAMEECGELVRAISKVLRHGMTDKNYTNLVEEIGDVQTMINLLVSTHGITWGEVEDRVAVKMVKLAKYGVI